MSKKVDEKVVEMSFDNSKFEKNIQTSISSLDRLKEGLNFSGAARGLDEIAESAGDSTNEFSALSTGIESVGRKFSALEVIAITALAGYKITTKMEDSDGNYVTDANGDYIETVVLLANPDDLLSILERVVALEKAVYEK